MADKLSLPTRKNLRDFEEKKKANLGRLEAASGKTGLEFTIREDIKVAGILASSGYTDRLGEIFYETYLTQLAESVEKLCQDPNTKAALGGTWTSNKLYFELDENTDGYQQITFPGGDLRMCCKSNYISTNIYQLGDDIEKRLTSAYGGEVLPLKSAANLRQYEEKMVAFLGNIGSATGKSGLEFQIRGLKAVDAQLIKSGYNHRSGDVFFETYLQNLSEWLTKFCQNDHAKNALNRKWTSNKIYFELDEKSVGYQQISFPAGDMRLSCKADYISTNIYQLGDDIPDQLVSDHLGTCLSLKSAQNIREYEEKGGVYLAAIGTAIGRGGPVAFVVEDLKAIDAELNKQGYNNRVGEVLWETYLKQISEKLTSLCADDLAKESIADSFKNNLVFKLEAKTDTYQNCKFKDGNLVMFCKPEHISTNIYTLGDDIEKQL